MTSILLVLAACNWAGQEDYQEVRDHLQDRDGDGDAPPLYGGGDCDDLDAAVNSHAVEVCNGVDDDCDQVIDGDGATDRTTWFLDLDEDGFGLDGVKLVQCEAPQGYVDVGGDCDDGDASVNPGAQEVCDDADADEDCDGAADDADDDATGQSAWPEDLDGDGYGSEESGLRCDAGGDFAEEGGDCDDGDSGVNPGATEICENGVDDDCDGTYNGCFLSGELTVDAADARIYGEQEDDRLGVLMAPGCTASPGAPDSLWIASISSASDDGRKGRIYRVEGPLPGTTVASEAMDQVVESSEGSFSGGLAGCHDLDGDGTSELAIGAPNGDIGAEDAGVVFVLSTGFAGTIDDSSSRARIISEEAGQHLGRLLAWSTSLVPGTEHGLVVVAPESPSTGSVLLFAMSGGDQLTSQARASIEGSQDGGVFGIAVAVLDDANGDGVQDLAVGSQETTNLDNEGVLYLYEGPISGAIPASSADTTVVGASLYGLLSVDLTATVDLDGDGLSDLLVSALSDETAGVEFGGALYGFLDPFSEVGLTASDASFAIFGDEAVSFFGTTPVVTRAEHNGQVDLVLGAAAAEVGGRLYQFIDVPLSGVQTTNDANAVIEHGQEDAVFGGAIEGSVDLDADGYLDIAAVAYKDATIADDAGGVYFFYGSDW